MTEVEALVERASEDRRRGRHAEAEVGLVEAVRRSRGSGARRPLILSLKALAHVVRDLERVDEALPMYEEAVALSREEGDDLLLAHTIRHLGDLHMQRGQVVDADRCYAEAISLYRAAASPPILDFANALRAAAVLSVYESKEGLARGLWQEARELYATANVAEGVQECEKRLSKLR